MTKAEASRIGGRVRGGRKAEAARRNARKARAVQIARDGYLFGRVMPSYIQQQERPKRDWSCFECYRNKE